MAIKLPDSPMKPYLRTALEDLVEQINKDKGSGKAVENPKLKKLSPIAKPEEATVEDVANAVNDIVKALKA